MAFKVKEKKNKNYNTTITLDATHNNKINELEEYKNNIEETKVKLKHLENELHELKQSKKINIERKLYLIDTINDYKLKISKFDNKNEDINYLLDNKNLLVSYYDDSKSINLEENNVNQKNINSQPKKNIIDFFNKYKNEKSNLISPEQQQSNNYKIDRKTLFDKYLLNINSDSYNFNINNKVYNDYCSTCKTEKTIYLSEGKQICNKCGDETDILVESDKPSYKDPPREITYFSYKRINHFNEWLAQFQAKETTDIPKEIYENIIEEIHKERIDINNLNPIKLRSILKKIKKNKYYEHIPHILNKLNGKSPPIMTREIEEELRRMFKEIQIPFHKFCPKERKNFLSYSYVLHKFVELLELDEFIDCFILLKSREKLHQQDQIWKKICEYLKWEYIPSI